MAGAGLPSPGNDRGDLLIMFRILVVRIGRKRVPGRMASGESFTHVDDCRGAAQRALAISLSHHHAQFDGGRHRPFRLPDCFSTNWSPRRFQSSSESSSNNACGPGPLSPFSSVSPAPSSAVSAGMRVSRLVALEAAGSITVVVLLLLAEAFHRVPFVDLALTLALLGFGAGLVFARFLERWL